MYVRKYCADKNNWRSSQDSSKVSMGEDRIRKTFNWNKQDWSNLLREQAGLVNISAGVDRIRQSFYWSRWVWSNFLWDQVRLVKGSVS